MNIYELHEMLEDAIENNEELAMNCQLTFCLGEEADTNAELKPYGLAIARRKAAEHYELVFLLKPTNQAYLSAKEEMAELLKDIDLPGIKTMLEN